MKKIARDNYFNNKRVCVTGGAGFIGSHLIDKLIDLGATVTVVDNLFSGELKNVTNVYKTHGFAYTRLSKGRIKADHGHQFLLCDCLSLEDSVQAIKKQDIVFHLACNFGGRGYIDTHPADCSTNFSINTNVFHAAHVAKVERVTFASSACVYPQDLQDSYNSTYLLKESDAFKNNWANADQEYGWAKLMGEMTLAAYYKQYNLQSSVTRYVTAYGPGENDTHAIIALIGRAVEQKDPYIVWGTGDQDRDFTYVDDIVEGTLRACEFITDASAVNIGTSKRYTIKNVIHKIFSATGFTPKKVIFDTTKPEGVPTRALDISQTKELLSWHPEVDIDEGIERTVTWYKKVKPRSIETIR